MAKKCKESDLQNLPVCAADFIKLVIRKMRYRKKVRADVQAELVSHFEDELRDCKTDEEKEQKAQRLIEDFGDVKLLAVLLRRAKKRCRPIWRTIVARTFQTVGILILCFISYCVYISLGRPTISVNYVEEATRLARPVADESLNAAPIYQKAIDAYKEPDLVKYETGWPKISLAYTIRNKDWVTQLTGEELATMKRWLSHNADAIDFFKQASEKPYCWWEQEAKDNVVMFMLQSELSYVKNLVRMMVWQAKLKAYDGHTEEAFDDLLACYRAGRHFKGPRSLTEQLVGMGIQAISTQNILVMLNNQKVDSQLLKNLQSQLDELAAGDTFTISYEVERLRVLDFLQRYYTNNGRGSGNMIPGGIEYSYSVCIDYAVRRYFALELIERSYTNNGRGSRELIPIPGGRTKDLFHGFIHGSDVVVESNSAINDSKYLAMALLSANRGRMIREFEKCYNTAEKTMTKTPWQLHKENFDFELDNWSTLKQARYWPVSFLIPAIGTVNIAYRHKIQVEALITTLALIRFRQSTGDYPGSLDELVAAGYLKKIPLDPFSDKPLVYKKADGNFILYSVGFNFKDDDGQVQRNYRGEPILWDDEFGDAVFWPVQK